MKDLIILGNGMAGMTAALYAKRANLDFKIIGKDEYDFGQIGEAILVENYPCAPSMSGYDLAHNLLEQLAYNDVRVEEHVVEKVEQDEDGKFIIRYKGGGYEEVKSVIYALGASHRKLSCKIDDKVKLHYCALCDGAFYKDKTVAVIGGGDVAFTEAEYLSKICKQVLIIMCDENVTAAASTFERVSKIENIHITYNFPVVEIRHSHNQIALFSEEPNSRLSSYYGPHVDGVFVAIGMIPNTAPIKDMAPFLYGKTGIISDERGKTKVPGFFAAGDVRIKAVRQSVTAAADGANAVYSAIEYLKELASRGC